MAIVASVLTGLGVFWGLRGALAAEGGASAWLIPAGAAIGLFCLLATSWHFVLGMAPRARGIAIPLVLGTGLALTGLSITTSAWWLTSALGGGMALRHHHEIQFAALTRAIQQVQDQAGAERRLLLEIDAARHELQQAVEDELKNGTFSGKAGPGPVTRELENMSAALFAQQLALAKVPDERDARIADARDALDQAKQASQAGDEAGVDQGMTRASRFAAEAARLDMIELASVIQTVLASDLPPVQKVADKLRSASRDVRDDRSRVNIPQYRSMTRAAAVLHYPEEAAAAWAVAIALESLVFALLCVLVVRANLDRMQPPDDDLDGGTPIEVTTLRRAA
jgi:hypothetical protein